MELVKLNEVYTITDNLEKGWRTQGQVVKEVEGNIRINFYTNNEDKYVGSYNYDVLVNNEVRINIASEKGLEDEYTDYCQTLLNEVLKVVK